jgi:nitrite reductase (NADH) small subunit
MRRGGHVVRLGHLYSGAMSEARERTRLCGVDELPAEGGVAELPLGKQTFCVAKVNGAIAALDNECPHHGGPLGQGVVEDGKVVCLWHAYAFDAQTGVCKHQPKLAVKVYDAKIVGEDVLVVR